jgi:hypothetical protein
MKTLAKRVAFSTLLGAASALLAFGIPKALGDPEATESVTGHVAFVNSNTGNHVAYSLNPIKHQDGAVTGEFEEQVHSATGEFVRRTHGTWICLTVTGNVARAGGVVTEGSGNAPPPGTEVFVTVVDNGQGANDPPDLASPGGSGPGTAIVHCATGLRRPLFPVVLGNVQVRPTGL